VELPRPIPTKSDAIGEAAMDALRRARAKRRRQWVRSGATAAVCRSARYYINVHDGVRLELSKRRTRLGARDHCAPNSDSSPPW
jgi:hypothetical protein